MRQHNSSQLSIFAFGHGQHLRTQLWARNAYTQLWDKPARSREVHMSWRSGWNFGVNLLSLIFTPPKAFHDSIARNRMTQLFQLQLFLRDSPIDRLSPFHAPPPATTTPPSNPPLPTRQVSSSPHSSPSRTPNAAALTSPAGRHIT